MSADDTKAEDAIAPILNFAADHNTTTLGQGPVEVIMDGRTFSGTAEVKLDLGPSPRICVYAVFDNPKQPNMVLLADSTSEQRISFQGLSLKVVAAGRHGGPQGVRIKWLPSNEPVQVVGDNHTKMQRVISHVFNLRLRGNMRSSFRDGDSWVGIEHIDLDHERWRVRIRTLPSTRANQNAIRERGGHRLTHVVEVSRSDNQSFNGADAHEALEALRNLLGFAIGRPCDLTSPSGISQEGKVVWSRWSAPRPWQGGALCWYGYNPPEALAELYSGFVTRWADRSWRETLATAIWWYVSANSSYGGLEQGIVAVQIALEALSHRYCVTERRLVSEQGFNALRMADKARLLLSSLEIPTQIPCAAGSLTCERLRRKWEDGPHALADLRNGVVHARKNRGPVPGDVYMEAWLLAVWFLELAILALCGFHGQHWNRVTRETELVPWTTP